MPTTVLSPPGETPGAAKPAARAAADHVPQPMQVFAVDDQPLCLRGLEAMLDGDDSCAWAGAAGSIDQALAAAPQLAVDIVMLDHRPPANDAVEAMTVLRACWPAARFVLLGSRCAATEVRRAMAAGASCVLDKAVSAQDLVLTLRAIHSGLRVVPPELAEALDEPPRDGRLRNELTRRELTLVGLMARGLDNRAIADAMGVTVPTVKFHVTNVMSKLHAPNRTAVVLAALRGGIITLHEDEQA